LRSAKHELEHISPVHSARARDPGERDDVAGPSSDEEPADDTFQAVHRRKHRGHAKHGAVDRHQLTFHDLASPTLPFCLTFSLLRSDPLPFGASLACSQIRRCQKTTADSTACVERIRSRFVEFVSRTRCHVGSGVEPIGPNGWLVRIDPAHDRSRHRDLKKQGRRDWRRVIPIAVVPPETWRDVAKQPNVDVGVRPPEPCAD